MFIGVARVELHIPGATSLKDRRRVVKGLKDRLVNRHRLAVSEVDAHDLWQRAVLGVSAVGRTETDVRESLEAVRRQVDGLMDAECIGYETSLMAFEDLKE